MFVQNFIKLSVAVRESSF